MSDTLLATKLHSPPTRPNLVPRTRLTEQLEKGAQGKLTLVAAPAGFGKTTLVSDWARNRDRPVAWLSLDEADNDPIRFLDYIVAALQGFLEKKIVVPDLTTLQSPVEPVLSMLINEAAQAANDITLVLDDYYLIQEQAVHQLLTFLLEHQPATMHLVIISRDVPPLPLARLRLRDQLTELEAAELRFTTEEAAAFLNQVMGLGLTTSEVATLEARTEGWIAALQAAALSMRGRRNTSAFIQAFTGSHRYILDYLAAEVLQQQPERVQHFLLQTSILDRMSGSLCTAVTGQEDAQATLEMLESANLFIIPLDDQRHWYRYHRLFADFLRNRLRRAQGERVSALHSAAAKWYAQADLTTEAVNHSLAAGEFDWAVEKMEESIRSMIGRGQIVMLANWLESLPAELLKTRPQLSLAYSFVLIFRGQLDAIEPYLQHVENALPTTALSESGDSAPSERRAKSMLVQVVALRALVACGRGEVNKALELSRQALDHLPADDLFMRGIMVANIAVNLTDAYGSSDEWALATRALRKAARASQETGHVSSALIALNLLGELEFEQGKLHQAEKVYLRTVRLADARRQSDDLPATMVAVSYIGLARILYEWNELDKALFYLKDGVALIEQGGERSARAFGALLLARAYLAGGDSEQALATFREAKRLMAMTAEGWVTAKMAAIRVQFWLIQGQLEAATAWAEASGLGQGDQIGWRREDEYLALARVRLAQGQPDQALALLTWLSAKVEGAGMMRSLVKSLTLLALASEATGDRVGAMTNLERTLALAEPEGYVRTFVDLGPPMMGLLQTAFRNGIFPGYSRKLLEAFGEQIPSQAAPTAARPPLDPLTKRELEVLALVAAGQSNQEIANSLFITVGTVKRHVHNIYGKLGTGNRAQATSRAGELGLL